MDKNLIHYLVSVLFMIVGLLNFTRGDAAMGSIFLVLGICYGASSYKK